MCRIKTLGGKAGEVESVAMEVDSSERLLLRCGNGRKRLTMFADATSEILPKLIPSPSKPVVS